MIHYIDKNYTPNDKDLIAMYYVERAPEACPSLEQACEEIAKESSIGTWTDIITMSKEIAEKLRPSAYYIDEQDPLLIISMSIIIL